MIARGLAGRPGVLVQCLVLRSAVAAGRACCGRGRRSSGAVGPGGAVPAGAVPAAVSGAGSSGCSRSCRADSAAISFELLGDVLDPVPGGGQCVCLREGLAGVGGGPFAFGPDLVLLGEQPCSFFFQAAEPVFQLDDQAAGVGLG